MEKDLISILLPVYNSEKYLRKCLDALKNQTYENIEIICVNDGSTDSSYEILLEYQNLDNRFKVFTQDNSGPAKTRNHCLSKAQGEFIMFCDSDDTYEPNMCQRMIETIKKENVNLVMCLASLETEEKVERISASNTWYDNITPIGKVDIKNLLLKTPSVFLWHKIFKKSLIDKYNLQFPDGLEGDDCLFCYEYFCVCETAFGIKDKLYNYLIRENSIMDRYYKRKSNTFYDCLKIMKVFYDFLVENNFQDKYEEVFHSLFAIRFLHIWKFVKKPEERQEYLDISKEIIENIKYERKRNNLLYMIEKFPLKKFQKAVRIRSRYTLIHGSLPIIGKIEKLINCFEIYRRYRI